jgi:chromate transporter
VAGFKGGGGHGSGSGPRIDDADTALGTELPAHARPNRAWSFKISAILLLAWLAPVLALLAALGPDNVYSRIAVFFSQMAVVTFGGAYAVLAYVAQEAVGTFGWVRPEEMIDGLGMAESTPGPLIMVTQFVGFMAAMRNAGPLEPLAAATLGAILTTWVTFLPCFLWIFLGAPFVERLRGNAALSSTLTAITAAVVGVILNLAIWFALHALFRTIFAVPVLGGTLDVPDLRTIDPAALLLTLASMLALFRLKLSVPALLAIASAAGLGIRLLGFA